MSVPSSDEEFAVSGAVAPAPNVVVRDRPRPRRRPRLRYGPGTQFVGTLLVFLLIEDALVPGPIFERWAREPDGVFTTTDADELQIVGAAEVCVTVKRADAVFFGGRTHLAQTCQQTWYRDGGLLRLHSDKMLQN